MNIVVLAENYPHPDHPETQAYIHYRSLFYKKSGLDFSVVSFRARESYAIDGISVFNPMSADQSKHIDLCIVHAANLRNHVRFLWKNLFRIKRLIFIFHGYEALITRNRSIRPDDVFSKNFLKYLLICCYDILKLPILKLALRYFKNARPTHTIIVSDSLLEDMVEDMKVEKSFFDPYSIVNNPINPRFNESTYSHTGEDDLICIRNLDDKKYGADLFVKLAGMNPKRRFHLYGKGNSFDDVSIPQNLKIIKQYFDAEKMIKILQNYKACVLFTRWDSQGILACEVAAMGMPLITSDLSICREMLSSYANVGFVSNDLSFDLEEVLNALPATKSKNLKFTYLDTTSHELKIIKEILCVV